MTGTARGWSKSYVTKHITLLLDVLSYRCMHRLKEQSFFFIMISNSHIVGGNIHVTWPK